MGKGMHNPATLFAHRAARRFFDLRLGWELMRNPRISAAKKSFAIAVAIATTGLLLAMEFPLEAAVGFLLPLAGPALDLAVDGMEIVLFPLLLALAILPHLCRE